MELKTRTIFWPLTIRLKDHYILYWFLTGTIFLLVRVILLSLYAAEIHIWTELFFSYFIITGLTASILYVADVFDDIPSRLLRYFASDLSEWREQEGYRIFDRRHLPMWMASIWVNVFGTITLVAILTPSKSAVRDLLLVASIQPVFFMCGHTCYVLTMLGLAQRKLVSHPLSIPFLERGHRLVGTLSTYVYFLALGGLIEYLGLFVAVRLGPTRHSDLMAPWLICLAVTPIIIFGWGIYHVHILQREIKVKNFEIINSEVNKVLQELRSDLSKENVEKLAKLVEIQERIEATKEWPIAFGSVLTLILALAAAIGQILASASNLFKGQVQ